MKWHKHELADAVFKASDEVTLWKSNRGIVKIKKGTLAARILIDGRERGFVFHGSGQFALDAIVETDEGAMGSSIEKTLDQSFIALANTFDARNKFEEAAEQDLAEAGYQSKLDFIKTGENLCDDFFSESRCSRRDYRGGYISGNIFGFRNAEDKFDVLIAKGSKIIYKDKNVAFVTSRNHTVLGGKTTVVTSHNGKSVIVKDNGHTIIRHR